MGLKLENAEESNVATLCAAPAAQSAVSNPHNVVCLAEYQAYRQEQERAAAHAEALRRVLDNAEKLTW